MADVIVDMFDARGGPPTASVDQFNFKQGPTDEGDYVIAWCGVHTSGERPDWSGIPWGTPLKDDGRQVWVWWPQKVTRKGTRGSSTRHAWVPLIKVSKITRARLLDTHFAWYGTRKIPSTWIFNDFGHTTCYMFKDLNDNLKFDPKTEKIHDELFHPTPDGEAAAAQGFKITLGDSHGCIHVKPDDIDFMQKMGYMKKGNLVHVHKYTERLPPVLKKKGKAPFEIHFYPGAYKILVKGRSK